MRVDRRVRTIARMPRFGIRAASACRRDSTTSCGEPRRSANESCAQRRGFGIRKPIADQGFTFIEVAVVSAIIAILASAILPLAKVTMQRERELELRRELREMRTAIDKFKDAADQGKIAPKDLPAGADGYPPTMQVLVDGVPVANDNTGARLRFLRRIPIDPMTRSTEWGMRSSRDEAKSTAWGGQNVFDVYSTNQGRALDGTKYSDW